MHSSAWRHGFPSKDCPGRRQVTLQPLGRLPTQVKHRQATLLGSMVTVTSNYLLNRTVAKIFRNPDKRAKAPLYHSVSWKHELCAFKRGGTDRVNSPSCSPNISEANRSMLYLMQKWLNVGKNQRISVHLHCNFSRGKQHFSSLLYFYILFSLFLHVSKTVQKGASIFWNLQVYNSNSRTKTFLRIRNQWGLFEFGLVWEGADCLGFWGVCLVCVLF